MKKMRGELRKMPIINVKASISIKENNDNSVTNSFDKDFNYATMTNELFDSIMNDLSSSLKIEESLGAGKEGEDILTLATVQSKAITNFSINMTQVADDTRKIIITPAFQQQHIEFVKGLQDVVMFTQPNKFNFVFFVEKGFADLPVLQVKHMDFLARLSSCIEKGDTQLDELRQYFFEEDIKLTGNIMGDFSFIYEGVKWEVTNFVPSPVSKALFTTTENRK